MNEFLEQTYEILMCENAPSQDAITLEGLRSKDLLDQSTMAPSTSTVPVRDYASMHDSFLEALLQEQAENPHPLTRLDSFAPPALSECPSSDSFSSHTIASQGSSDSMAPPDSKKRRLKLHNRRSSSIQSSKRSLNEEVLSDDESISSYAPTSVNLKELVNNRSHVSPDSFLSSDCQLQKDKGKGDVLGSEICATGRDACMEKLRQKMELLAQVALGNAGDEKKRTADMKRRKAKISSCTAEYTETRSIIFLKMGFLAMQYGILLRWDCKTQLITFVLLRKMCSESFYKKKRTSSTSSLGGTSPTLPVSTSATDQEKVKSTYEIKNVVNGNCAILQHDGDIEMFMLDPPYLVPRPFTFDPSLLSINVLNVDGLNPKSTWIVKVMVQDDSQTLRLGWNADDAAFQARNSSKMKLEFHIPDSAVDLEMSISVYEQKKTRPQKKRLKTTLPVPMTMFDAKPASSRFVIVPVGDASSLTLSLNIQSDFGIWLQQEVNARKRQEAVGFMSFFNSSSSLPSCDVKRPLGDQEEIVSASSSYDYLISPLAACCAWLEAAV
jgi:hypothetical protein